MQNMQVKVNNDHPDLIPHGPNYELTAMEMVVCGLQINAANNSCQNRRLLY